MKNFTGFLILTVLLLFFAAQAASLPKMSFDRSMLKDVKADRWNVVGKNIMVSGNIRIPADGMELTADQAVINTENRDIEIVMF